MKAMIGYVISAILAPLAGYFVGKKAGPELGATITAGIAGAGARMLHLQEPPSK